MQFATLQEAYPNYYKKTSNKDTVDKTTEKFINDYNDSSDCYYSKKGLKMPNCDNFSNKKSNDINPYNNDTLDTYVNINTTNNTNNNTTNNTNNNTNNNTTNNNNKNNEIKDKVIYKTDKEEYLLTKTCSPLQVPEYKLPIDSNTINVSNDVLNKSIDTNTGKNDINRYSIKPYDYDEYDAYLNINDIKTNNIDPTPEYRTTPFLEEYLKSLRDNFRKQSIDQTIKLENIEQFTNNNKNIKVDVNLYNLFLFIFIGIIIILLCDQIIRLAIIISKKEI